MCTKDKPVQRRVTETAHRRATEVFSDPDATMAEMLRAVSDYMREQCVEYHTASCELGAMFKAAAEIIPQDVPCRPARG